MKPPVPNMTFNAARLVEHYPRLYHMAAAGSWPTIKAHGLLSTSAILDLFEVDSDKRRPLEAELRKTSTTLTHPLHGTAVIRDQLAMNEAKLRACLRDGLEPTDWYRLLNGRVFFWLKESHLAKLLKAKAYRPHRHLILTLDTRHLVDVHQSAVELSPYNSGSTLFAPPARGRDCFLPIADYPFDEWRKARGGPRKAIAEFTVRGGVPDVVEFVIEAKEVGRGENTKVLYTTAPLSSS